MSYIQMSLRSWRRRVKADPATLQAYDWVGRTIERHQAEIRAYFGLRVCRQEDGARIPW